MNLQMLVTNLDLDNMKTLQRNFTTPEQSKRLLELGVPAWTADLYFYEEGCISNDDEPSGVIPYDEVYEDNSKETMFSSYVELPCWSVGRLIEIHRVSTTLPEEQYMFAFWYDTQDNVEWAIRVLESGINTGNIDFSKLKE